MCDAAIQNKVNEVVQQWVKDAKAFTAYDVTIEVRAQLGRAVNVPHNEVREAVRYCDRLNAVLAGDVDDNGDDLNWYKTLIAVGKDDNGDDLRAFLYHHENYNPSDYKPQPRTVSQPIDNGLDLSSLPPSAPVPTPVVTQAVDDGFFHVDSENRLLIPTSYFKAIGADAQSQVNVVSEGDKVYVIATQAPVGKTAQQRIVDANGDMRLRAGTLLAAGMQLDKFKIENCQYNNSPAIVVQNP